MFRKLSQREQKFYNEVAEMVTRINGNKSTIKTEVYKKHNPDRYHALLHKIIINYPILKNIVKSTKYMKNIPLGAIMVYEILTGKLSNDGYKRKFKKALGENKLKEANAQIYIRINTLVSNVEELNDLELEKTPVENVYKVISIKNNNGNIIKYILSNYSDKVKIQNLASCLPAFILNPEENSTVIDGTAAPGNKTTHLATILNNTGKVFAIERDKNRFEILKEQVEKYGATNVECKNQDFLTLKPEEYKVDYILLDPSCSGSGIHINYEKDQTRIDGLKNFQAMMLNHAFKFNPKKVVYSICSVHAEEGEEVVKEALEKNSNYEIEKIGDFWGRRGIEGYDFSDSVIRAEKEDETIGFFVALFKRKE